jgi:tetratricopeptide (TPR) repeat protein
MLGISAHNLGVISILAGRDDEALVLFEEAVDIKRQAFGRDHPEIAVSLDEIGIQFFAKERYGEALVAFYESLDIISKSFGPLHPRMCMLKNNIACCNFVMGTGEQASMGMKQALEIQQQKNNANPSAKYDLDLLHMAIVLNNSGYVKVKANQYDEAMADFEEALLVRIVLVFHEI